MEREELVSIVSAVQNGEENAATVLYEKFHNDIYYYILKTVNDPELAADLTQDTFIEILQTIDKLREPAAFVTWSKQIAYHRCTAHFRKRKDLLVDENEDESSIFDSVEENREEFIPDEALDKDEFKKIIQEMIDSLSEEQRSAIMMRYFDEMSVKEIAQVQDTSEGTVKSRLNYARKAIKQAVEDYEKKNGVKLHCAGVVPLLLWFWKENQILETTVIAEKAAVQTASAAHVAKETIKEGTKQLSKKAVFGISSIATVTAGVATIVLLQPSSQLWTGYGDIFYSYKDRRFEVVIEELKDDYVEGHLNVSYLYEDYHDTDFEGVGIKNGDEITYSISFESPLYVDGFVDKEYTGIEMNYNEKDEKISFDGFYDATLIKDKARDRGVIATDVRWSGVGRDSLCVYSSGNHTFLLDVYSMSKTEITGKLTVKKGDVIEHESEFAGRGFVENREICYEIQLKTIRETNDFFVPLKVDNFWLFYDFEEDMFYISELYFYSVEMEREK